MPKPTIYDLTDADWGKIRHMFPFAFEYPKYNGGVTPWHFKLIKKYIDSNYK